MLIDIHGGRSFKNSFRGSEVMSKVTESIFNGKSVVIPMADVQHFEKCFYQHGSADGSIKKGDPMGALVITKHTKWNFENDCWENAISLTESELKMFIKSFNLFRCELEGNLIGL